MSCTTRCRKETHYCLFLAASSSFLISAIVFPSAINHSYPAQWPSGAFLPN